MPGRAIKNKFIREVEKKKAEGIKGTNEKCLGCIETPFCITRALINAVKGDIENALLFVGSNAYRINKITTVNLLIKELVEESESC